jgi:hypothetical protein
MISEKNSTAIPLLNNIILSNTCVGWMVINALHILPYNNPFISTLIPNDNDYIKLINNLYYYLNLNPVLGDPSEYSLFAIQNKSRWYKHQNINTPYPVIYLDDIEIHCIHENNLNDALNKFIKRFNRMKEIIYSNNYRIISLFSFSEVMNEHPHPESFFNNFFEEPNHLIIQKYFMGPQRHNVYGSKNIHYIVIPEWENISAERTPSYIYKFNDQEFNKNMFLTYLEL